MTSDEFEQVIEQVAKVMEGMHNRLMRVEEWMLKQDGSKKECDQCHTTKEKKK